MMNDFDCPYKNGDYCSANVGKPVKKKKPYPYGYTLFDILSVLCRIENENKKLNTILIIQSLALLLVAGAVILSRLI